MLKRLILGGLIIATGTASATVHLENKSSLDLVICIELAPVDAEPICVYLPAGDGAIIDMIDPEHIEEIIARKVSLEDAFCIWKNVAGQQVANVSFVTRAQQDVATDDATDIIDIDVEIIVS